MATTQLSSQKRTFDDFNGSGLSSAHSISTFQPQSRSSSHGAVDAIENCPVTAQSEAQVSSSSTTFSKDGSRCNSHDGLAFLTKKFAPGTSIVLAGGRGTGKSTLAVITSVSSGRQYVDAYRFFKQQTRLSMPAARQQWSASKYATEEAAIFKRLLSQCSRGCVIVWPSKCAEESAALLRDFGRDHPIIHLTRDSESTQNYLKLWLKEKPGRYIETGIDYSSYTDFEFYNLSEHTAGLPGDLEEGRTGTQAVSVAPNHQFLKLKCVEQDYLRFLSAVLNHQGYTPRHDERHVLPLLARSAFTYAIEVSLSQVEELDLYDVLNSGADAIELKVDYLNRNIGFEGKRGGGASISRSFAILRRLFPGPVIIHIQTKTLKADSEQSELTSTPSHEESYLELLHYGLKLCPEYLTVDLRLSPEKLGQICGAKGATKIIGHLHESSPGVDDWSSQDRMAYYQKGRLLGCNLVRLTQHAKSVEDNFSCQAFAHRVSSLAMPRPKLIAYNTGHLGRMSSILNSVFTPVTTPAWIPTEPDVDGVEPLPLLTPRLAQTALFSLFIFNPMRTYILGTEVSGSLSPVMHNAAYKHFGMQHHMSYRNITTLEEVKDLMKDPNFGGASVAQGPRIAVTTLVHAMGSHARAIGAVNTLIPIRNLWQSSEPTPAQFWKGRNRAGPIRGLYGDNTDWIGIGECISRNLSPANTIRQRSTAVVIGAGGMARGAIYALLQLGLQKIFLCNRTVQRAEDLRTHFNRVAIEMENKWNAKATNPTKTSTSERILVINSIDEPWPPKYAKPTIIVCCVPAIIQPGETTPNIQVHSSWIESPTGGVVVDIAYNPTFITPLIRQMRKEAGRGWVTADGLDILPQQGAAQFELLTGRKVPLRLMRLEVLRNYKVAKDDKEAVDSLNARLENLQDKGAQLDRYF